MTTYIWSDENTRNNIYATSINLRNFTANPDIILENLARFRLITLEHNSTNKMLPMVYGACVRKIGWALRRIR